MLPLFYRLHGWLPVLAQEGGFSAAKAVHDAVMQDGEKLGNSSDSVRLGVIFLIGLVLIGLICWGGIRFILSQKKEIEAKNIVITDDLRDQIKKAEEQRDAVAAVAEREREGRREDQRARNLVMQYAINEFNAKFPELKSDLSVMLSGINASEDLLRRQLNLGPIPPRQLEKPRRLPPLIEQEEVPEPASERAAHGRTSFLPSPSRRIAPRPHGGPREGRQLEGEDEQ